MPVERLTDADARILAAEQGNVRGHTLKVLVGDGNSLGVEEVRAIVASRIHLVPELRMRLRPAPLGLANPALVDDPGFRVEDHVNVGPAAQLDEEGLRLLASLLMSRPLDRRRPLWNSTLVPELDGGGWALILKVHHALADGMSAVKLLSRLLIDDVPDPPEPVPESWNPSPPGDTELLRGAALEAARSLAARPAGMARSARAIPRAGGRGPRALVSTLRRELGRAQQDSPFDSHVGPMREVAWTDVPLEQVKDAAHAFGSGVTVNDVVLSLTAAGLRRWMLEHGREPFPIRVQIPVSLHRADEGEALGNRDSSIFVGLPLDEPDPIARLRAISDETRRAKAAGDAETLEEFFTALRGVSHTVESWARRRTGDPRVFGLNISNVPGPAGPRWVAGRPLRALHSLAEVGERHVLRVAVMSASGRLSFGICSDQVIVAGLRAMLAGITEELDALAPGA